MTTNTPPNAEQVRYWNEEAGPRWVALQERSDAQLRPIGLRAMDAARVRPGERVLDVGAGCGDTTLELARRVGPSGHVQAVDVVAGMLQAARERARAEGLSHVAFQCADAQTDALQGGPFDLVFSRFGIMFFDDPPLAFRRLREATRSGGRLAACCWRSPDENPWLAAPIRAVARILDMPPPPDPHAPGPFGLFDRARTLELLATAGWVDAAVEPFDMAMTLGGARSLEEGVDFVARLSSIQSGLAAASPEAQARALDALRECIRPHVGPDGVRMPGAAWILTASAP